MLRYFREFNECYFEIEKKKFDAICIQKDEHGRHPVRVTSRGLHPACLSKQLWQVFFLEEITQTSFKTSTYGYGSNIDKYIITGRDQLVICHI